jgi:CPA1 family monovalent cation:H+ antiporter
VAGVVLANDARAHGMAKASREALDVVWEFIAFVLTALAFLLIGLAMSVGALADAVAPIAWGVVAILVGRAIVVYGLLGGVSQVLRPATRRLVQGRPLPPVPMGWLHVLFWAGLRGAVAVAMALSLPNDFPRRELLQSITFGIVLFTLFVQGTTAEWLVRRAGFSNGCRPGGIFNRDRDARLHRFAVLDLRCHRLASDLRTGEALWCDGFELDDG